MIIEHEGKRYCIEGGKHCTRAGRMCLYAKGQWYDERVKCSLFGKELPVDTHGRLTKLPECALKKNFAGKMLYTRLTNRENKKPSYEELYSRLSELEDLIEVKK